MSLRTISPTWHRLDLGDHLLAESPRWVAQTRTLGWVDILGGTLGQATWDRAAGWSAPRVRHLGGQPTSLEAAPHGAWDVVRDGRLSLLPDIAETLTDPGIRLVERLAEVRTNDTTRDPAGRLLVGLFAEDRTSRVGGVLQIGTDGSVRRVVDGLVTANGLGVAEQRLYVVDTARGLLLRHPYDVATGEVGEGSVLVEHDGPGKLDGLLPRPDGTVLVAVWGEGAIHRYDGDGRLLEVITAPASRPTALAAVTTAGPAIVVTTARDDLESTGPRENPGPDGALHLCEEIR